MLLLLIVNVCDTKIMITNINRLKQQNNLRKSTTSKRKIKDKNTNNLFTQFDQSNLLWGSDQLSDSLFFKELLQDIIKELHENSHSNFPEQAIFSIQVFLNLSNSLYMNHTHTLYL